MSLREQIEALVARESGSYSAGDFALFNDFKSALNRGILLGFRMGTIVEMAPADGGLQFLDNHTYPIRRFSPDDRVRIVPGGSSIRDGAYIAPGVVCMPPMFVNAGAYVDEG